LQQHFPGVSISTYVRELNINVAQKTEVQDASLHKAALVSHKKINLCAKFWTDLTIFGGRAF